MNQGLGSSALTKSSGHECPFRASHCGRNCGLVHHTATSRSQKREYIPVDTAQIASLPDAVWEWARTFLLFLQYQGQRVQSVLARNRRLAERYHRLTIYDVLFAAATTC